MRNLQWPKKTRHQKIQKNQVNRKRFFTEPLFVRFGYVSVRLNLHLPMSDSIKHECGIALIRLRKPLIFYLKKYGTALYGLNKLYLLMEKQHNRGQDGAGVVTISMDPPPGKPYMSRERSNSSRPIADIFQSVYAPFRELELRKPEKLKDVEFLKANMKCMGEVLLGHLRYGTHGED